MATNFIQPGEVLTLTAPSGGVVSGTPKLIGSILVVPLVTAAAGVEFAAQVCGVWSLPKTSAQAWTEGQKIYWDNGNARCDSDSTVGQLIGVAEAVAANPSSTGRVRLNGVAPATAEGAQGAIVALTDNTGGSGSHDDTLADGFTTTAFDADNGGATADGTVEAMTALPVAIDLSNMDDGAADNVLIAIGDTTAVNQSGNIEQNFDKIGDEINTLVTLVAALANNVQECVDKIQTITTDLATQNQNDSDLAQKVLELRTALIAAGILTA